MSLRGAKEQICLVSGQNLPNYMGVHVADPRPETVHLLVTGPMQNQADILEQAVKRLGCTVKQHSLPSANPGDVFECLCAIEEHLHDSAAINVTGGTKLMALAAVEWAHLSEHKPAIFYIDTQQNCIFQLSGEHTQEPLSCRLSIAELLSAGSGYIFSSPEKESFSKERFTCLQELLTLFIQDSHALTLFNKVAKEAKLWGKDLLITNMPCAPSASFTKAMDIAQKLGKVEVLPERIVYPSQEARKWCNGAWLEEYVREVLASIYDEGDIDDYAVNLELYYRTAVKGSTKDAVQNEIDAAFSKNGMLYLLECKTSVLEQQRDEIRTTHTMAAETLYKLDSLKTTLGGTFGKGMVVSVLSPRAEDKKRAQERGLRLIHGAQLLGLKKALCGWITNER